MAVAGFLGNSWLCKWTFYKYVIWRKEKSKGLKNDYIKDGGESEIFKVLFVLETCNLMIPQIIILRSNITKIICSFPF